MRRTAPLLIGIAIGIVLALYLINRKNAHLAPPRTVEQQNAAVAAALAAQNSNTVAVIQSNFAPVQTASAQVVADTAAQIATPPAGPPAALEITNMPAETAIENMSRAIRQYGQMFGGNPVGTNPEFARELGGDNPKHINFISIDSGMRLDADGELVDPWGTPYFFHQISGDDTEVRSAGPDRVMYTSDDIVIH
ncbi:MAG TPA: hypothetical protein VN048_03020 [Verrucomicrobiae bacterium]|jgi:hypothetical protein|nr:hypothetical protein [Verrucomicrobiae bacterium]